MKELDLYSFVFRGTLAEEALDKEGRLKYSPEAIYFSEEVAKKLFLHEIDEKYDDSAMSVIPTTTAQVAVYATLQVLEELGLLTLPKKQD